MADPTNAERQRRWRERQRAEKDPVRRYLRDVMAWGEAHGTAGAGKLALAAAKMLEAAEAGPSAQERGPSESLAFGMLGWAPRAGRAVYTSTESGRIALAALRSAQKALEDGSASERTVSAGLAMAKHLAGERPTRRDAEREASLAIARALLGRSPLAPAHLCAPADGPSAEQETDAY